jgi:hypothetical protein
MRQNASMNIEQDEEWRPVPGFEGLYAVSSLGRVRSFPRPRTPGKILKPGTDASGYPKVALCRHGIQHDTRVHVIVTRAFHGEPAPGHHIRHLDGDKRNNRADNLAASPPSLNTLDMVRHGRHNNARKTTCKRGHEFDGIRHLSNGRERRVCRTCARAAHARNRDRRAQRAAGITS